MELPECPVCLQPYDFSGGSVPRVLPCGHSVCEDCLCALPRRLAAPSTVRCPACNVLVRLPDLGPSALPKNVDLLRFYSVDSRAIDLGSISNPRFKSKPNPILLPLPWSEDLYSKWKQMILPHDSISLITFNAGLGTADFSFSSSSCSLKNHKVTLLPLAMPTCCSASHGQLRLSYMASVMSSLQRMGQDRMNRLHLLIDCSLSNRRGISKVFGLWMDIEDELLRIFIVCEMFVERDSDVLNGEMKHSEMAGFAMTAMEMCEAVMTLHTESIACGCLLPDCFTFDEHGRCILDLSRVLLNGKLIHEKFNGVSVSDSAMYTSPEIYAYLHGSVSAADFSFDELVGYGSDVWSLACVIVVLLCGDAMIGKELFQGFCEIFSSNDSEDIAKLVHCHYEAWKEKVVSKLEVLLLETELAPLLQVLISCLSYQPQKRPQVKDMWSCFRCLLTRSQVVSVDALKASELKEAFCLIIGDLCPMIHEIMSTSTKLEINDALDDAFDIVGEVCSSRNASQGMKKDRVESNFSEWLDGNGFTSTRIEAHNDCITALAVGGDYLFSASFDKTIKIWLLQDFSLVQTLKGHEHKIMAMVVIDGAQPLCMSGDSASGIFVWLIGASTGHDLLKTWYEHNDWRYSGIHSLAVSETSYLYSGGGDKSIKAWSLKDYSLSCVMTGHKSTVSSLTVTDGVLYSGSWDGTIRLWSLYDHSLLSELLDSTPGSRHPVLSLSVDRHFVISSYEDGYIKIWSNEMFAKSIKIQKGAILAMHVDSKWICTGGWDMIVSIQELSDDELQVDVRPVATLMFDSVVTSLLHWHGKLFVGFSNKIKVFCTAR